MRLLDTMSEKLALVAATTSVSSAGLSFISQATAYLQLIAVAVAIFAGLASGVYYVVKTKQLRKANDPRQLSKYIQ